MFRALAVTAMAFFGAPLATAQNQPPPTETTPTQPPAENPPEPEAKPESKPEIKPEIKPESKPGASSVDPALRAMFEQASQRIRDARTISFHCKATPTGSLAGKMAAAEANVRMHRPDASALHWQFRATGSGGRDPDQPPIPFDVTWDRQNLAWLDTPARKLFERPYNGPKVPLVQAAVAAVPTLLREPAPFTREMAAEALTLEGTETIGGVKCDVVAVRYRPKTGLTRYWLAESDRLPRKIELIGESTAYPNSTIYELTDLKIDEPFTAEQITLPLPDGFERDSTIPTPTPAVQPVTPAGTTTNPPGEPGATQAQASPHKETFPPAPAFELTGPDGAKVSLASMKGSVVVLYFWGTWSLPSRKADPQVQALHEAFKDRGVKVLGLSVREKTREAPAEFLRSQARTYLNLPEADAVARRYTVVRFPTFVLIDADGGLRRTFDDFKVDSTTDEVRSAVESLLVPAIRSGGGH